MAFANDFTGYNRSLISNAKQLRRGMTKQEQRLWFNFLRSYPIKIYRQRSIDNFIVDFYCSRARLVIELDGSQHCSEQGEEYDKQRTRILESYGLRVIRFSNTDISRNFDGVCYTIDKIIKSRL